MSRKAQIGWSLIVVVWLPMLALLVWGKGGLLDLVAMRRQVRDLQGEVRALEKQNAQLRDEIDRLKKDPALYEPLARERYFMKKPGEVILYLPPKPETAGAAQSGAGPQSGGQSSRKGGLTP